VSKRNRERGIDMSKENTSTNIITGTPQVGEQILHVPLTEIYADYAWNCRSSRNVQDMADTESSGFDGFVMGIKLNGQLMPVILRHTNGKTINGQKTDKKYELIVGFRRLRGVTLLNTKEELDKATAEKRTIIPNVPNGCIAAVVRQVDNKTQARVLNGHENIGRKNLKAPDLVFLAKDLAADGLTQQTIGDALGITQGWVSRLLKVGSLPAVVLANWRDGTPIPPTTTKDGTFTIAKGDTQKEMTEPDIRSLADLKCSPEEVIARYIRAVKPAIAAGDGPGTGEVEKDKVLEEVRAIATLMGCMVRAGVLDNGSLDWTRVIGPKKKGYPIDCGNVKDDQFQQRMCDLGDAATEAFETEVSKGAKGKTGEAA